MTNKKHTNEEAIEILKEAIDSINRQNAEIERLQKEVNLVSIRFQDVKKRYENAQTEIEQWKEEANRYQKLWCIAINDIVETAKSEAYKEFAEKLKKRYDNPVWYLGGSNGFFDNLDNFVKEMVGDTE